MISGAQVRAARKLLGWTQDVLASHANVSKATIAFFETNRFRPSEKLLSAIWAALQSAGVEITNGGELGVKLKAKSRTIAAENLNASNDE